MRISIAAKCFVFGLGLTAALLAAEPAFAQLQPGLNRSLNFWSGRIQCAAASDLCGWRRIPGGYMGLRGYRGRPDRRLGPGEK